MTTSLFLRFRAWSLLVLFLGLFAAGLAAPVRFDIPAQPAPAALQLFIKQSGAQVMFVADELKNVTGKPVAGDYEPLAALRQLLQGTGYTVIERKTGWFAVVRESDGSVKGRLIGEGGKSLPGVLVAIRETGQSTETDKYGQYVFPKVAAGTYVLVATAAGYQPLHITDVTVGAGRDLTLGQEEMRKRLGEITNLEPIVVHADAVTELEKLEVTGIKGKPFVDGNLDLPRTMNDAQPYYILDSKTIDTSGAANIEDFLKNQLTMNTTALTNGATAGLNTSGNTSSINLRGLGTDKTLILVDGRRMAGVAMGSTANQTDLNGIPLSSIDRIEVLPSSASGIYGGSAIGGVVNVILKRNYQGGEIRTTYDNTWDTDSPKRTVSLNYGLGLEGGKTHLDLSASWSDSDPLLIQDRADIIQAPMADIQSRSPAFIISSTTPWLGSLPNITTTSASLILKGSTSLNSKNSYVPAGTSSSTAASTLAAGLLANAGQWNLDFPASTQSPTGLLRHLVSPAQGRSLRAAVRRQMLPQLELFAEFSYSENNTDSIFNVIGSFTVPVSAPTNPFTTAVVVRAPDASRFPMTTQSVNRSVMVGAVAQLPKGWTGTLDYTWSENRFNNSYYAVDADARTNDLASGALNPLVDTLLHPLDLSRYMAPVFFGSESRLHDINLKTSGALPALPWGRPNLSLGLERRLARTPERVQQIHYATTASKSNDQLFYAQESSTDSGYAELTVPVVKPGWAPGVHALELQVSGRRERYTVDTGTTSKTTYLYQTPVKTNYEGTTLNGLPYFSKTSNQSDNYTVGLKYQPVPELTLRLSRATAFVSPTPDQLIKNPAIDSSPAPITDPRTGLPVSVNTVSGGNPDLKPQSSKSLNAGLIWEPRWRPLQGLRLNVEYYRIEQFNAIANLSAQDIVYQESLYPDRVTRDASGTITLVDISKLNLYRRETEGWDLSAAYTRNTAVGSFTLTARESIIRHLKTQYYETLPAYDAAGYSPGESGAPKYKSTAALSWAWRGWSAGWTTRYLSAYKQYGAAGGPYSTRTLAGAAYSYYITAQGSDTIPSQAYHDLFFGYAFRDRKPAAGRSGLAALGPRFLEGLSVQFGVRNVFDKVPPLDAYYPGTYYLSPYGDLRLRSYWLTLKKEF